jgi:xylitol oxidase
MSVGQTWAGTYTFGAAHLVEATSVEQVQRTLTQAATDGGKVRALGTRHSFHDLADSVGTLVTVTGLPPAPAIDTEHQSVSIAAGIKYGDLALWLQQHGWALHNLGSLPHISVGGAIATSTHGSGIANGALSTSVNALEYVNARGDLATVRRGDADFDALVVGLGAYGIAVRVHLDIQPTFLVRQDVYTGMTWDRLLADFDHVMSAAYSVSVFTLWDTDQVDQVWCKARLRGVEGEPELDIPDAQLDATRNPISNAQLVDGDPAFLTEQGGTAGPWLERLPHFRHDCPPSNGDEIQTEYFVARKDGPDALRAVRELAARIDPHLYITELRTVAADSLWLSGAYERDALAIHFTWKNQPDEVRAVLPDIERALAPFAARPHWGKVHTFDADAMAKVHPRLADARDVFERLDPDAVFSNHHLERLGVRRPS